MLRRLLAGLVLAASGCQVGLAQGGSSGDDCPSSNHQIGRGNIGGAARRCGIPCASVLLSASDTCRFNVSSCIGGVQAGSACEVGCKAPYAGTPVLATCPLDNADGARGPDVVLPDCDLPGEECSQPAVPPEGYERGLDGAWNCAPAYAGRVEERCVPDSNCATRLELSGCQPMQRCRVPEVDPCKVDVTDCEEGVWPGGSCIVRCKAPYEGATTTAMCYPGNTRVGRELLLVAPECSLTCSDPLPVQVPQGYERDGAGGWQCSTGYGGVASWRCAINQACTSRKEFSGCMPLQPCGLPAVADVCLYDFSDCADVAPGASCQVRCRSPYVGEVAAARCPEGNTNASQPLVWTEPSCKVQCAEVAPVPVGYVSYPYSMTANGWRCEDGFAGTIVVSCTTNAHCEPEMRMDGCRPMIPCTPPTLTIEEFCMYDMLSCVQVQSGQGCDVSCREPYYVGTAVRAECPGNNTDPQRQLEWVWPVCTLQCPDPEVLPDGYDKLESGEWVCAQGYVGAARTRCVIGADCVAEIVAEGCEKLYPCILPPMANDPDTCLLDWSDCANLAPGASCELRCRAPYVGSSTTASCSALNTEPDTELSWTHPHCTISCENPSGVPGYEISEWECADGYVGTAEARCTTADGNCIPAVQFSGCRSTVPCAPPNISSTPCMFNASDCASVKAGGSCEMRCSTPYVGRPVRAFCIEGNTDPSRELFWTEPGCQLPCPDPDPVPPGYAWNLNCGWHCAAGWAGSARKQCSTGADCRVRVEMSGCARMVPCAPLRVNDTCRFDISGCLSLRPGETCGIMCKAPYSQAPGTSMTATCPRNNTDPLQLPVWSIDLSEALTVCSIDCPQPQTPPVGYELNVSGDNFLCAPGYIGQAQTTCLATEDAPGAENCTAGLSFEGCLPIVACKMPAVDVCQFDTSDCGDYIQIGQACEVRCLSPYILSPGYPSGRASCPSQNTNSSYMDLTLPTCDLGCLEPTQQDGYVYHTLAGVWMCATGWIGKIIRKGCSMDPGCIVRPLLTGCTPLQKCQAITLTGDDVCRYDVSDCTDVMAGTRCTVRCKWPLLGYYTRAACDSTNTDPTTPLRWNFPECRCRPPDPLPAGYERNIYGSLLCTSGYLGRPSESCTISGATCSSSVELSGCTRIVPCASLSAGPSEAACRLDDVNCSAALEPGGSCSVGCASGYRGSVSEAECPADNTDPAMLPRNLPSCEVTCPEPSVPQGYRRSNSWRCSPGYWGVASAYCANSSGCGSELQLSGCNPETPCTLPTVTTQLDQCRFDFSNCYALEAGSYCEVRCRPPFKGKATRAFCLPGRMDSSRELVWVPPDCDMDWPDPSPFPEGYIKTALCGWQCAPLYYGPAVVRGAVDEFCTPRLEFSGCFRTQPCRANPRSVDLCRVDASDCFVGDVPAGFTCEVRCRSPYSGTSAIARCPDNNTQFLRDMIWAEPDCNVSCQDPDPLPNGYVQTGNSSWECAPQYVGTPLVRCISDEACANPTYNLSGCALSYPCKSLTATDPCRQNVSGCSAVQPGSSCTVGCLDPYVGEPEVAICPEDNIDPMRNLEWQEPTCTLSCLDFEPLPKGYVRVSDGWKCAEDATGTAVADCSIDADCNAHLQLAGCSLLQPCRVPPVNPCTLNVTDCLGIRPGETCFGFCEAPFVGPVFNGSCPADNIDPWYVLSWAPPPLCDCPDPSPVPRGYEKVLGEWRCTADHIGTARMDCTIVAGCVPVPQMSGCTPILPCAPPDILYLGNRSQCQSVPAGTTCKADCINTPCIGGGPLEFHCPPLNIDGALRPTLTAGRCDVACEVCEVEPFVDMDPRRGMIGGVLRFGPAQAGASTALPDIEGYRVHFADACGTRSGTAVDFIPRRPFALECCSSDAYMVTLGEMPLLADTTHLVITVVTSFGELPHGKHLGLRDSVATPAPVAILSSKGSKAVPGFWESMLAVMCSSILIGG